MEDRCPSIMCCPKGGKKKKKTNNPVAFNYVAYLMQVI